MIRQYEIGIVLSENYLGCNIKSEYTRLSSYSEKYPTVK
mgnify:CR=1 FL=1|jgi:hypothetical protein